MFASKTLKKLGVWGIVLVAVSFLAMAVYRRWDGSVRDPVLAPGQIAKADKILLERPDGTVFRFDRKSDGTWLLRVKGEVSPADPSRILDFLYVFNFWEIARVPDRQESRNWEDFIDRQGGRLQLKSGFRTLLDFAFARQGDLFLIRIGGRSYAMRSVWKPSAWMDFFSDAPEAWRNRLLMDFAYTEIRSVEVRYDTFAADSQGQSHAMEEGAFFPSGDTLSYKLVLLDPVDAERSSDGSAANRPDSFSSRYRLYVESGAFPCPDAEAENYLSAFTQIFFDPLADAKMGKRLYSLTIEPLQGEPVRLSVFEKLVPAVSELFFDGRGVDARAQAGVPTRVDSAALSPADAWRPDIFKAVVVCRGSQEDTVQMPYVFLDKMAKRASWFVKPRP